MIAEKKCTKCGRVLPLEEFHRNKAYKTTGRSAQCRDCVNKSQSKRGDDYRPLLRSREGYKICTKCLKEKPVTDFHTRYGKPRPLCKTCNKQELREAHARRREKYYQEYPEKRPVVENLPEGHKRCTKCGEIKPFDAFSKNKKNKQYGLQSACKACKTTYAKKQKEADPVLYNKNRRAQANKRHRENIETRIKNRLRCSLRRFVHDKHGNSYEELAGCTMEELREHLESLFEEGMSWDNHAHFGWHIDHIKPMSSFDLTKEDQIKECCHFTNLRPLWWKENLSKGAKIV